MRPGQRGLSSRQEQASAKLIRDTRPLGQKVAEFFQNRRRTAIVLCIIIGAMLVVPVTSHLLFLIGVWVFIYSMTRKIMLPFRLPQRCGEKDYNDKLPGSKKPRKARGIYLLGNENKTGNELWFGNDDMRTHMLIFGSTGSGKTEALVSLAYNALIQSSGFIYVDGKGDNSLFAKIFSMVKIMGREDDLLLINFMTGARDIIGAQEKRISNTLNPFSAGSSSMLANLVTSLMDSGGSGSDGDMWKGRAISFVEALMKILVYMRDQGSILLDANTIRNYFGLDRLEAMAVDKVFIRDDQYDVSLESAPALVMDPIRNYLGTLPGWVKERKGKQVSQVFEQHGYITMQLTKIFSSLADTYGHILRVKLPEVDLKDVVLNRRILTVLLPALEKSPDELANLGKIVIASMKTMMAAGLGDAVEGTYEDVIGRKPTNAPTPYLCILDEYGYYAVKGFAVVPAQARSLGFSVVFAGQDLPAFQKASKEEAASIGANTNIKICMKLEDPADTWEFFMKGAGESYVTTVESFNTSGGALTNTYQDTKSARTEKRARIDLLDLKEQDEGEFHVFFKSRIVRARSFYANPTLSRAMRLNHLLRVDFPGDADLYKLVKGIEDFEINATKHISEAQLSPDSVLETLFQKYNESSSKTSVEKGVSLLLGFVQQTDEKPVSDSKVPTAVDVAAEGVLNVFMRIILPDELKAVKLGDDTGDYSDSILDKNSLEQAQIYILKLLGLVDSAAKDLGDALINDMALVTTYSPPTEKLLSEKGVADAVKQYIDDLNKAKHERDEKNV